MKKIFYLFLVLPLMFSSCSKEEDDNSSTVAGCTDPEATNYNTNATVGDESCTYNIAGVWETQSAILNGQEVFDGYWGLELHYIFDDSDIGFELYNISGDLVSYSSKSFANIIPGDPNILTWSGIIFDEEDPNGINASITINIDQMTNANNMTWHYVDYPNTGDVYIKTLVKSNTYDITNWK